MTDAGFLTSQIRLRQTSMTNWWQSIGINLRGVIKLDVCPSFFRWVFYFYSNHDNTCLYNIYNFHYLLFHTDLRIAAFYRTAMYFYQFIRPIYFLMKKWIIMKCSIESDTSINENNLIKMNFKCRSVSSTVTMLLRM